MFVLFIDKKKCSIFSRAVQLKKCIKIREMNKKIFSVNQIT